MDPKFEKAYDPHETEQRIYKMWEEGGYFKPEFNKNKDSKPFTIVMPPPNANGRLHAGHALFLTLEDIMIRYKRMRGLRALWIPGADHAGFETQIVYEKKLEKEKKSRFDLTRQELYKQIYDFTMENKKYMEDDIRRMGASCDWDRARFTLDPDIIDKVQETFVKMYKDGLIYRGKRPVNWCTKHQTSLSEVETLSVEREDPLYYMKYGPFVLATVRPETKFGDTAVAVNPDDERYKNYIGKEIEIETLLGKATLKVIADSFVDPEFGTGVVKVTPAHDPNDFEMGIRHNLEIKEVIDQYGKLNEKTGPYQGLKVKEAREKIAEDLKHAGLIEKIDTKYKHIVKTCYKCDTVIEPRVMDQWFVKMESLTKMASKAYQDGKLTFIPPQYGKVFDHWMNNPIDWNISRQIVWGIPIPAWYETKTGTEMQAVHFPIDVLCEKLGLPQKNQKAFDNFSNDLLAQSNFKDENINWFQNPNNINIVQLYIGYVNLLKQKGLVDDSWIKQNSIPQPSIQSKIHVGKEPPEPMGWIQDTDTFDTWFSSGQWPLLVLDYPDGADFKTYYPTSVMETGYDLVFKWVPRMVIFGLYKTGEVPFHTVYMNGLVNDAHGKKMSKSKGNVISPIDLVEKYGTDALRMGLVYGNAPGNDLALSEDKIKGQKHFANKIWNASRFVVSNTEERGAQKIELVKQDEEYLKELERIAQEVTEDMEAFRFHIASEKLYHYFWHTFADQIIEEVKERIKNGGEKEKASAQHTLIAILTTSLKLLHPFMPYVTEEVWQLLPFTQGTLMVELWPSVQ